VTEKPAAERDSPPAGREGGPPGGAEPTRNIRPWGAEPPPSDTESAAGPPDAPGPASLGGAPARPAQPAGAPSRSLSPLRGPVKILFVEANAFHDRPLQLNKEYRDIVDKLRASRHRGAFELLPPRLAARAEDLRSDLLEHEPHVVHFAGHGGEGAELMLLDERDRPAPVSTKALASLFRAVGGVRLVVFNACFSAEHAAAVGEIVGLAIGMRGEVSDRAARGFASAFYEALGYGRSVRAAFDLGVTAVEAASASQGAAPRLVERPGVDAAGLSFVGPPPWRRYGPALALALAPALALALAPAIARPPPPAPAPAGSSSGPSAKAARPESGAMVGIDGARIEIGATDRSARPPECEGGGGDEDCSSGACPGWGRRVEVAGFFLDATEVTNDDFARWLGGRRGDWHLAAGGSGVVLTNASPPVPLALAGDECGGLVADAGGVRARAGAERRPAACVTWQGANDYCRGRGKRLPTSAEWELAAKGPQGRPFPWGAERPTTEGVAFGGEAGPLAGPRDVASSVLDRTPEGVFDLGGNVAEWVGDDGGDGRKALRGGSWHSASACKLLGSGTALRPAKTYGKDLGFRCASDAPPARGRP
jgi:formylglycine-generating enzyme required for sulfatase activity